MAEGGKGLGAWESECRGAVGSVETGFKKVLEDTRDCRALEASGRSGCDSKGSGKPTEGLKLGSGSMMCSFRRSLWLLGRRASWEERDWQP